MSLLARASLRHLSRHWAQCALAISGIALGVALVVAIQVAQASARHSFANAISSVFGQTTHQVLSAGRFPESSLAVIRRVAASAQPQPVVEGRVRHREGKRETNLRLIGVDMLTAAGSMAHGDVDLRRLLLTPATAIIGAQLARKFNLALGAQMRIDAAHGQHLLTIVGTLPAARAGPATILGDNTLLTDIATAQELLGLHGQVSRIDLNCPVHVACQALFGRLRAALPEPLRIESTGRRRQSATELTRAFYTNLDALSLLALMVGAFMIYNTMSFLVLQRQRFFSRLRALGVRRIAIMRLVIYEATLLGLGGGGLGIILGYTLAARLIKPITQTMRDHYFNTETTEILISIPLCAGTLALALVISLLAALIPAIHAAQADAIDPASASWQRARAMRTLNLAAVCALGAALCALTILGLSSRSLLLGFSALGLLIVAAMLGVPRLVQTFLQCVSRRPGLNLASRLTLRSAEHAMSSIGMAVAALMAATATSIGIGLMVASFRGSVDDWLEHLLHADLYVSQLADERADAKLSPQHIAQLRRIPGIAALSLVRRANAAVGPRMTHLNAYELPPSARLGFNFIDGDVPPHFWRDWEATDIAIITQPYAYHQRLRRGEMLAIETPSGTRQFRIGGIYRDYGSEQGVVTISLARFRTHWRDTHVHGAGVYAAAQVDLARLSELIEAPLPAAAGLGVWSNRAVKQRALAVFDRTFAVTDVLTMTSTLIAALGVFNALLALHLERNREYMVMLALGSSPQLLRRVLYAQAMLVGTLAALLAIPLGCLIAEVLIKVINVRSFGWSMDLAFSPRAIVLPALCAVLAAVLAAIYPTERTLRIDPASALRYE